MDSIDLFKKYIATFEVAFKSGNWALIEPYFADNAVYVVSDGRPLGGRYEGHAAVMAFIKDSVDRFDRRFDERDARLTAGPEKRDGSIWFRWQIVYSRAGLPDLTVKGQEIAYIEDGKIVRLEDVYDDGHMERLAAYLEEHQAALLPVPV